MMSNALRPYRQHALMRPGPAALIVWKKQPGNLHVRWLVRILLGSAVSDDAALAAGLSSVSQAVLWFLPELLRTMRDHRK